MDLNNNDVAEFDWTMMLYWAINMSKFITAKIKDKEVYASWLRKAFADSIKEFKNKGGVLQP